MKLATKIAITVTVGAIAILALATFNQFSYTFFSERLIITDTIDALGVAENDLNVVALQNNRLEHLNQDALHEHIGHVNVLISKLDANEHLQKMHPKTLVALSNYRVEFDKKVEDSYDFQTISSTIKNSSIAILNLQEKSHPLFHHSNVQEDRFLNTVSHINITILKSTMALTPDSLVSLHEDIKTLKSLSFAQEPQQKLLMAIVRNSEVFINTFDTYVHTFELIQTSKTTKILHNLRSNFIMESDKERREMATFALLLVILYILSLGIIVYFIVQAERDILTDKLTTLQNRKAFETYARSSDILTLVLININKFKNYNDFYGVAFGDQILIQTAKRLIKMVAAEKKAKLFRIGGDEFGITCITHTLLEVEAMAKNMADTFQDTILVVDNIEISVAISVAITNHSPLLETADMALKELKKYHSKNVLMYTSDLHLFEHIQTNVIKTHILDHAIKDNKIFPHFQPIVSMKTGKIEKYESLARLKTIDGEVQSIVGYLEILKESRHASTLTRIMIQKSCEVMKDKTCDFSINLSIEDINDPNILIIIDQTFLQYPNISKRVIFEILESEAVEDYQKITDFIQYVKLYGCKIAIDDFGSGYSNFTHILNLDIDILKIDGSLIRHLDSDQNAIMIVETIVDLTRKAGIQTVAEFVCSEAIYNKAKELGVDCSQGYYTGKPEAL
jgi:diguanylate cyclase (GGDEF)-like protein